MAVKQPTILQIIPELDTGGAELSTIEICDAIVRAGGRAIVLSEGGRLTPRITASGGEFIPFPAATKNPLKILWNAHRLGRLLTEEGVDLVHARSRAPAWCALIAARRAGKPFVTTYHGAYRESGRIKNIYNSVMARGDIVIANSRYTRDLIHARYGTSPSRLRIIYRGVDGRTFDPASIDAARVAALRAAWGLAPETRIILQAARLTNWKGQSVVIAAAKQLRQEGKLGDAIVVMAGDAQGREGYRERLETEIASADLKGQVRLVGHVDDIPAAFRTAHVAVVASTGPEAFGRAATEAQVMGCPVISTNIGAPPETVLATPHVPAARRTGWLVPPDDAPSLASALSEALSLTADDHRALGDRARSHVLTSFSLDAMRRETLAVYDEVLGTGLAANFVG